MIEITATIKALSPLHIGTGKKSGTFARTLDYLPGRTIRGMVGYHLYTNNRDLFDAMRISEDNEMAKTGVFFKDALPSFNDGKGEYKKSISSPCSPKMV